jgi:hypothetical protein
VGPTRRSSAIWLLPIIIGLFSFRLGSQARQISPDDNSDWWSITGPAGDAGAGTIQNRELVGTNFRILGVDLRENAVARLEMRLGKTPVVVRGDASTSREQACYRSPQENSSTFLIAEEGEVNYAFYLFDDSTTWNGRDLCTPSRAISREVQTASGLRLGLTQGQVIKILGKPSRRTPDELSYVLEVTKRPAPDMPARCRPGHPEPNIGELSKSCLTYDLTVFIRARFAHAKLVYLVASTTETN